MVTILHQANEISRYHKLGPRLDAGDNLSKQYARRPRPTSMQADEKACRNGLRKGHC